MEQVDTSVPGVDVVGVVDMTLLLDSTTAEAKTHKI